MREQTTIMSLCLVSAFFVAAADAPPTMAPIAKIADAKPNTWIRVAGQETGYREGSAFFWSEAIGRFVVVMGVSGDAKRNVAIPYDVQTLDPATGVWENAFPAGKEGVWGGKTGPVTVPGYSSSVNYFYVKDKEGNLRPNPRQGFPNGFAVEPDGSGLYLYARGYGRLMDVKPGAVWRYDVKARTWGEVSPEQTIDLPSHGGPVQIVGGRMVFEPLKGELLLLGGQAPNVIGGSAGNWAFSLERKAWRRLEGGPPPRTQAAVAYDPLNNLVVLFGGDHFDYMTNDTWLYNPATDTWEQVFAEHAPPPRSNASLVWLPKAKKLALVGGRTVKPRFDYYRNYEAVPADVWLFDAKAKTWALAAPSQGAVGFDQPYFASPAAATPDDVIVGISSPTYNVGGFEAATWAMKVDASVVDEKAAQERGRPGDSRVSRADTAYRTGPEDRIYDPAWYQAAPPGDAKAVEAWFAALKPNTWTEVPRASRHVPESEWGTAVYDPERDLIYYWTGGHMSDPGNAVHTYHPATNRWTIPYVAEIPISKGITFNGRPDCKNHTYHNYAFDPLLKRIVAATYGGTGVYDPDAGAWTMTVEKPYRTSHYTMNLFTTPKGILVWAEGFFGTFDAATMKYEKWPVKGAFDAYLGPDADGAVWDPTRKVMWFFSRTGWRDKEVQVFAYNLDTNEMKAMSPINRATLGQKAGYLRETVYLPGADLVLTLAFDKASKRQLAYDPAKNRWVLLNVQSVGRVGSPMAMVYDTKRDLVWCLTGGRLTYVLRVDPKALEPAEE